MQGPARGVCAAWPSVHFLLACAEGPAADGLLNVCACSDGAVPFLPGNTFRDPNQVNFKKSHAFDYRGGTAVEFDVPAKEDATGSPSRPVSQMTHKSASDRENSRVQGEFVPAFAGLDGKVLRFEAFITEQVPENLTDPHRVRKFSIMYYLVDDSIQINEHRQANSGYAQGIFMKRHRVPSKGRGTEEFVTLFDFADTTKVTLYNRDFHLVSCNVFTEQFFQVNNMKLRFESNIPEDRYMTQRALDSRMGKRSETPASASFEFDGERPETSMSQMTSGSTAVRRDMREKFLKYANKVLRFYATWDDRGSMFGQKTSYVVNYYLQDDKMEVLEVKKNNSGKDPFPKLVKKGRIQRHFDGVPSVGSREEDFEDQYINDRDLMVGGTIEIFGREMFLYDCDQFTREYYRHQYGIEQGRNQIAPEPLVEFPKMPLPPYNGFGSEHDSLASYFNLVPKPPKYDRTKQSALDAIVFRWKAKFDMDNMTAPNPDDHKRRFVISYFMGDGTLSVYEPPIQNSGFMGGKFLDRQRVQRHKSKIGFGDWITDEDMLIPMPGTVWINSQPFVLLETDKFTLRYLNKGRLDNIISIDSLYAKMRSKASGLSDELKSVFRLLDENGTGRVSLEDLVNVIRKFDFDLDEDELIALMSRWDASKNGEVDYEDFVTTIFD